MCGCTSTKNEENKYEDFEHYDLIGIEKNQYQFKSFNTYTVARIGYSEINVDGLFYRVGKDDYILLDEIVSCQDDSTINREYTFFYTDDNGIEKLYTSRCSGKNLFEFTLNGEKFEKKSLDFDTSKIVSDSSEEIRIDSIVNVEKENIYYNTHILKKYNSSIIAKCSLITYECEKYEG